MAMSMKRAVRRRRGGRRRHLLLRAPVLEPLEPRCLLSADLLDTSFGDGGVALTDFPASATDRAAAVLVDDLRERRYIVGSTEGLGSETFSIAAYTPAGVLDSSFGNGGIGQIDLALGDHFGRAAIIAAQGRIIVGGSQRLKINLAFQQLTLARYNLDGTLDTTFGTGGVVFTDILISDFGTEAWVDDLAIDSQNRIVAGGRLRHGSNVDFLAARYLTTGELDVTFGGTGWVHTDLGTSNDVGRSVAVDAADRVIVAGTQTGTGTRAALVRYTESGVPDTSFSDDGVQTLFFGTQSTSVAAVEIDDQGRIVAAGRQASDLLLFRLTPAGILDTSFGGGDGWVTKDVGGGLDNGVGLAIDASQNALVVAQTSKPFMSRVDLSVTRPIPSPPSQGHGPGRTP